MNTGEGLSASYVALTVASSAYWLLYGIQTAALVQILVNGLWLLGYSIVIWVMLRARQTSWISVCNTILALVITLALAMFGKPSLVASIATVFAIVSRIPQTMESYRRPGGRSVSIPSFVIQTLSSVLWIIYGLLILDGFVVFSSVLAGVQSLYVATRTQRARPRETEIATA